MAKNDPTIIDEDATPTVTVATVAPAADEAAAAEAAAAEAAAAPVQEEQAEIYHRVMPGDDWQQIAATWETTPEALYALNSHRPHFSERSVTVNSFVRVR